MKQAIMRALAFRFLLPFLLVALSVQAAPTRVLTDMSGDTVALPTRIERVATVGSVPVLNSLLFAVGEGRRIVNGLPDFAKIARWNYQAVFAPHSANLPSLQNADRTPNLEMLLQTAPDVALSMDRSNTEALRRAGIPALYLAWRQPEDVKTAVRLLGQLFDKAQAAERYAAYFDSTIARIAERLRDRTPTRPRVLFFSPATLTQPHLVAEWWIRVAGGDSVSDDGRNVESRSFTMEQLLAWDPDILIVSSPEEVDKVRLAIATLNALCESLWLRDGPPAGTELRSGDAFDALPIMPGQRVALVGAFPPYMRELRRRGQTFHVLELDPATLKPEEMPYYVPAERAPEILPQADVFITTGTTLINGTLDGLLRLLRPGAEAAVIGPTATLEIAPYVRRGVTVVGGTRVLAPDELLDLLAEGGSGYHFFGKTVERVTLRLPPAR